jgi:hypothetical protein
MAEATRGFLLEEEGEEEADSTKSERCGFMI